MSERMHDIGRDRHLPFINLLRITPDSAKGGEARISIELSPELQNRHAGGHVGVLATLLDCAMSHAAMSKVEYTKEVMTIDMSVAFLNLAQGHVVAIGKAIGGGRTVCFCEARITNADGGLAARAMGTFKYRNID